MCYHFQWKKMWFILCTFWIQSYGYKVSKYLTDIHWTSFFCKLFVSAHNSCNSLCNSSTFHQGNSSNLFLDIISTEFAYFVDFSINLIKSKNWFETPAYFEMRTPAFRVLLEIAVLSLWTVCELLRYGYNNMTEVVRMMVAVTMFCPCWCIVYIQCVVSTVHVKHII